MKSGDEYRALARRQHSCASDVRSEGRAIAAFKASVAGAIPFQQLIGPFFGRLNVEARRSAELVALAQEQLNFAATKLDVESAQNLVKAVAADAIDKIL